VRRCSGHHACVPARTYDKQGYHPQADQGTKVAVVQMTTALRQHAEPQQQAPESCLPEAVAVRPDRR